jgi:hypothetical membrane protein
MNILTKLDSYKLYRLLLLGGIAAPIVMVVIILIVGQMTPGYNPVAETVSQSATPTSPYAAVQNGGFVFYGLLMIGVARGFYLRLRYLLQAKVVTVFLTIHGIGAIFMAIFADSPDFPGKVFTDDIWHNIFSSVSYSALLLGMLIFARMARKDTALRGVAILGLAVIFFNLPLPMVTLIDPLKPVSGLLQRLFITSSFLWLILTSLSLYKMTLSGLKPVTSGESH